MIRLDSGHSSIEAFSANVCGREWRRGKPDPEIFLLAAEELGVTLADCFVVEDAPAGIEAARTGGIFAPGIAQLGDADLLRSAGADLVVTSLDEIKVDELIGGRLDRPAT